MGGSSVDDGLAISSSSGGLRTLVLVGCTGNGKSATGNSILQRKAFKSGAKSSGVTRTCELQTTKLEDGQSLNVIDTPGLFDSAAKTEFTLKEIAKCINMAKDGIHAVLVVLSFKTRFTEGEAAVVSSLKTLFGKKLTDCMIIVFTGGDELEYHGMTLTDYLGQDCPKPLEELLHQCENRWVLFDNRTPDQKKKDEQVQVLLSLVNHVVSKNDGKPYTDELFVELKRGATKLNDQTEQVTGQDNEEKLIERITEMVELKFKENTARLLQQLAEDKARHEQKLAEEKARTEQKLAEEKYGLEQKLSEEKPRFEQQQLAEEKARLEQKLAEEKYGLEQKLAEEKARFEQQLVEEKARFEQQLAEEKTRLEQKLAEKKYGLEQKFAEEKYGLEQKLAEEKYGLELKLAEKKYGLELKLVEEKARFEQQVAEEKTRLEQKLTEEKYGPEQKLAEEKSGPEQKLAKEKSGPEKLAKEKSGPEQKLAKEKSGPEQKLAKEKSGPEKLAKERLGLSSSSSWKKRGLVQELRRN